MADWEMAEAWTLEEAIANIQQTEDQGKRFYAAWWLGKHRVEDKRAFAALIEALEDETDRTPDGGYPLRRNAAKALGKLNNAAAVEPLITCLNSDDYYVRESAAQSLEMLGDRRAIELLLPLADDSDWQIRQRVAQSLGRLGGDEVQATLKKLAEDEQDIVAEAAKYYLA